MSFTHFCGLQPWIAKFHFNYDLSENESDCIFRHRFSLKQPEVSEKREQGNMTAYLYFRGESYTAKDHDASDRVPARIALDSGETKTTEIDVKRITEFVLQIRQEDSSSFFIGAVKFFQTLVLTAFDYKSICSI